MTTPRGSDDENLRRVAGLTGSTLPPQPLTIRCGECEWSATGDPDGVLEERLHHVMEHHPGQKRRGRRSGLSSWGRGDPKFRLTVESSARGRESGQRKANP